MFLGKELQLFCRCQLIPVPGGGGIRVVQRGLGDLHGAGALLTVVKLPLKLSETIFLHPPTQRMTQSRGCLGNLATHFCWEVRLAAAAGSETQLSACTSSCPYLPLDNCKDTSTPHQGCWLNDQNLSLDSREQMEGKAGLLSTTT